MMHSFNDSLHSRQKRNDVKKYKAAAKFFRDKMPFGKIIMGLNATSSYCR